MINRAKRSVIWKLPKRNLATLIARAQSFSEILRFFKIGTAGGNQRTLKARLDFDQINYSHIKRGRDSNRGRNFQSQKRPLQSLLIKGSTYNRYYLKRR